MFDQLAGLLLVGLGLRNPVTGNVAGEATDRKETHASRTADLKERRDQFKEKLLTIRDERKKTIVERVANRMSQVNTNRTNQMTKHLGTMSEILKKVASRAATAKEKDKDTSSVDSAVAAAQAAISAAQTAVSAQAGKENVVTISSETGVGQDVKNTMNTLQSDIKGVYAQVVAAREAVRTAVKALAAVL